MEKAMKFIAETNKRTDAKVRRLEIDARIGRVRAERRWKQTEKRLQVLLKRGRTRQRGPIMPPAKVRRRPKTEIDLRLEALAKLFERQISEGRKR